MHHRPPFPTCDFVRSLEKRPAGLTTVQTAIRLQRAFVVHFQFGFRPLNPSAWLYPLRAQLSTELSLIIIFGWSKWSTEGNRGIYGMRIKRRVVTFKPRRLTGGTCSLQGLSTARSTCEKSGTQQGLGRVLIVIKPWAADYLGNTTILASKRTDEPSSYVWVYWSDVHF